MNKNEQSLREQLINLLKGGQAYMTFDESVKDFPVKEMNTNFPNGTYSAWDLLEHIRITQDDILEFMVNPKYKEKKWPQDYWPGRQNKATKQDWDETIKRYNIDLKNIFNIINDAKTDLYKKIPWGDGQIILREILLVADHTSYHIGEFAIMRQVMKTWGKKK